MKRIKFLIIFLFSSALSVNELAAQSIVAQVSAKRVQVGEPFEFAVVISGPGSHYNQPHFRDFDVISGPRESSIEQDINGVVSKQVMFTYGLVARREGKFTIGAANALFKGKRMFTKPILIEAVRAPGQAGGNDPQYKSAVTGGDIFIRTSISKNKCFLGEQVIIVQKVYSRYQIMGYQKSSQPSYDGFYTQPQESPTKGQLVMENVDGVNYFTHEVLRTLATANKAGKITLSTMDADVVVRRQTNARARNIYEHYFGAPSYEDLVVHATSRPIVIEVLLLPEDGKPESFNGAVGVFTNRVEVTRTEVKANEALNLRITVSGRGNIRLINPPKLGLPDVFETYEPKVTEGSNSKSFDYLVIPRQQGEFIVKNLEFSYFNLDTKKYVTLPSPEIKIKVLAGDPNSQGTQVFSSQSRIKETENDIRYIKKGNFLLTRTNPEFFNSTMHKILLLVPLVLLGGVLLIRKTHLKNNSNQVLVRERKAASLAKKQLVNAEKLMKANKKDEFYTEILTAMNNYLSHKLNISVSSLSREKVTEVMTAKKVEPILIEKLNSTISNSEYARYAPGAVSGDLQQVYKDTANLITDLEQQLNKKV